MLKYVAFLLALVSVSVAAKPASLEEFARHAQFIQVKISPTGQYLAATRRADAGNIELVVIDRVKSEVVSQRHFSGDDTIGSFDWANEERLVISMARQFAAEGSKHGIRANSISPGMIRTPATEGDLLAADHPMAKIAEHIPLGRIGTADEVINCALFLASEEA